MTGSVVGAVPTHAMAREENTMTEPDPYRFAQDWIAAWNARDVNSVLAHFHEDATFSSPVALRIGHGKDGVLNGKPAIRDYWTAALAANPDLLFRLRSVYAGVDVIVIGFTTQDDLERTEVLVFENGRVRHGYGNFAVVLK